MANTIISPPTNRELITIGKNGGDPIYISPFGNQYIIIS